MCTQYPLAGGGGERGYFHNVSDSEEPNSAAALSIIIEQLE